jgi:hypothetical protein
MGTRTRGASRLWVPPYPVWVQGPGLQGPGSRLALLQGQGRLMARRVAVVVAVAVVAVAGAEAASAVQGTCTVGCMCVWHAGGGGRGEGEGGMQCFDSLECHGVGHVPDLGCVGWLPEGVGGGCCWLWARVLAASSSSCGVVCCSSLCRSTTGHMVARVPVLVLV